MDKLEVFRSIVDRVKDYNEFSGDKNSDDVHPFDSRNVHPEISTASLELFDNGHFSQATFEAYKLLDKKVSSIAGSSQSGVKLMMEAFNETSPKIKLNALLTTSEKDEQQGFKFIFAGSTFAIRNPRGHEINLPDSVDLCLDHLSLASLLIRTLDKRIP